MADKERKLKKSDHTFSEATLVRDMTSYSLSWVKAASLPTSAAMVDKACLIVFTAPWSSWKVGGKVDLIVLLTELLIEQHYIIMLKLN